MQSQTASPTTTPSTTPFSSSPTLASTLHQAMPPVSPTPAIIISPVNNIFKQQQQQLVVPLQQQGMEDEDVRVLVDDTPFEAVFEDNLFSDVAFTFNNSKTAIKGLNF